MFQRLISGVLNTKVAIIVVVIGLALLGLHSFSVLDIEAYPNPVAPMIEVITQPPGMSAEEVERYVTLPLETALAGMPGLLHIRSQSLFGLSDVKCYFSWDPTYLEAQQQVINRLQFAKLPAGLTPQLSPWNAVGEIYRYTLKGPGYSLADLKSVEDFILERQFKQVPGVIDVTSFGGQTREIHVDVDPYKLRGHNLTLSQLTQAVTNANQNVGGQRLTLGAQSFDVRGIGLFNSLPDVEKVVIASNKGVPVSVHDIAEVIDSAAPRLGLVGKDLEPDLVEGIVLMRYGGNALETLHGVHDRVEQIRRNHLLPAGMTIEPYYDRGSLTRLTTETVLENLLLGMLLVTLVLWLFLGDARAAGVAALNIPLALLCSFTGMVYTATPANLISLGAVDFGIIVDSTVIVVENIHHHLGDRSRPLPARIIDAVAEISTPMIFSTMIIVVAFLPLFTMTGVAGVIFSPLARTYAFSIGAAILLAVTFTPVLASLAMTPAEKRTQGRVGQFMAHLFKPVGDGNARAEQLLRQAHGFAAEESANEDEAAMIVLRRVYNPLFAFALRRPWTAVMLAGAPVVLAVALSPLLGGEFMPKLEEGNFWIRATLPMSISLAESSKYVGRMRRIILGCPQFGEENVACSERTRTEITAVVSQLGRPDDGTDPSGFYNIELFAPLKPGKEWREGVTKDSMTSELSKELQDAFPGFDFNFSQYIADNVEEAMSGVKGENTVKVTGPSLVVNEAKAREVLAVLQRVRGIEDLGLYESLGQPDVKITPDRSLCMRYGLNVGDVGAVIQAAIGGAVVTQFYQGEMHFDVVVRWKESYRKDLRALREILVSAPDGSQIPLGQLTTIETVQGPARIWREDAARYAPVKFSVRGRDLASTIQEAKDSIAAKVQLPYDTHLEWAGEINELHAAKARLALVLPLTLLLIGFLVFSAVKNVRDTVVVLTGIPFACVGGVFALLLTGTPLSVSAAMGFVSIFGVAVQDALLVVIAAQRLWHEGHPVVEAARKAADRRLRPVLMTASVALIGLLPAALSHGIGSETQRPLALVVIGGALALALLPRLLQPALFLIAHRNELVPHPAPVTPLSRQVAEH